LKTVSLFSVKSVSPSQPTQPQSAASTPQRSDHIEQLMNWFSSQHPVQVEKFKPVLGIFRPLSTSSISSIDRTFGP
jgi:hypothetical protein